MRAHGAGCWVTLQNGHTLAPARTPHLQAALCQDARPGRCSRASSHTVRGDQSQRTTARFPKSSPKRREQVEGGRRGAAQPPRAAGQGSARCRAVTCRSLGSPQRRGAVTLRSHRERGTKIAAACSLGRSLDTAASLGEASAGPRRGAAAARGPPALPRWEGHAPGPPCAAPGDTPLVAHSADPERWTRGSQADPECPRTPPPPGSDARHAGVHPRRCAFKALCATRGRGGLSQQPKQALRGLRVPFSAGRDGGQVRTGVGGIAERKSRVAGPLGPKAQLHCYLTNRRGQGPAWAPSPKGVMRPPCARGCSDG